MALGWYLMQRFESSYGMSNYLFESFCDIECTIMFIGCRRTGLGSILRGTLSKETHTILNINAVDIITQGIMIVGFVDKFCVT